MTDFDFTLLSEISLPSYDNGYVFTETARLDKIKEIAARSPYQTRIDKNRFTLYAKKPLGLIKDRVIVLSTHIDAVKEITRFYTEERDKDTIHGTFDNALTNAAALALMLEGSLPDNVLIAFTADEEMNSSGAIDVVTYLRKASKGIFAIVLDVTDVGYQDALFTVENNFYRSTRYHKAVKTTLESLPLSYRFVTVEPAYLPDYIPLSRVERNSDGGIFEALCDESWAYDEESVECFSLCIPIKGEMHTNNGASCQKKAFQAYKEAISAFAQAISHAE